MILDTSVLLRTLDRDPGTQGIAAGVRVKAARESDDKLTVLSATVLEAAYVLESKRAGYGWDRDAVAAAVEAIVDDPAFDVEYASALRAAAACCKMRSVDLHDCLLGAIATDRGTNVLSFDDHLPQLGTGEQP